MRSGVELMSRYKAGLRVSAMFSKEGSTARRRYQLGLVRFVAVYAVVVFCSSWLLRHEGAERFYFYFWSVIPALPMVTLIVRMGRYLQEETNEYQRLLAMRAILAGTATLMATLVVNELLRPFTHAQVISPTVSFLLFCVATAITQHVQSLRDRVPNSD